MTSLVQIAPGTWIVADDVVAVTSEGQHVAILHFSGGMRVPVAMPTAQVAQNVNQSRTVSQQQQQQQQQQQHPMSLFGSFSTG